jgi:hypothetical protein
VESWTPQQALAAAALASSLPTLPWWSGCDQAESSLLKHHPASRAPECVVHSRLKKTAKTKSTGTRKILISGHRIGVI